MAFVEVNNLVKHYPSSDTTAVDNISFEIHQGEIFSLLGPNGAGKTTTISILSTLISPTDGSASVDGRNVLKDKMTVRRTIGVVPQELALYDELSAEENLRFWGEMQGIDSSNLKSEIQEKLTLMELQDRAKDRVKTYSGGMKRRLNLAVGLLGNPPLLMLDEPTVAIDPQSRRYILDWVKKMNEEGITILYTTHYMEEAQELSHRIGIMDRGKLIAIGTLEELTKMVGEKETLNLKLYQKTGGSQLADAVKNIDGIDKTTAKESEVILNVKSAEDTLSKVLEKASNLNLSIRTIEIQEPNLEAVFLHLTGRALRD
ncbi:MAG: ATP-binding cassette domain-containing protein [Brevefilum sp.]